MQKKLVNRQNFVLSELHWWFWIRPNAHAEPLIEQDADGIGPRDQALTRGDFLVAFDVWWTGVKKASPAKGFLGQPSAEWFYVNIQLKVPLQTRTFCQVIDANRTCCWYFDVDARDIQFPMQDFLQALFEEMCHEQNALTVEQLWYQTLLLDATCNVFGIPKKASCHGICHALLFDDNHTHMKKFAHSVKRRLELRPNNQRFRVLDKGQMVIPLDLSVYSTYRCFRLYGNVKMTPDAEDRRPFIVAPYNRSIHTATDELGIFTQSLVLQPEARQSATRHSAMSAKRQKRDTAPPVQALPPPVSIASLEAFLLRQVQSWGNMDARINQIKAARCEPSKLYVSFANATHAMDHKHQSNNVFAIVDKDTVCIRWHCHTGGTKCGSWLQQQLPMEIALALL